MRRLPVQNPPNPWARTDVAYEPGETPDAGLQVFFDQSKSILSKNDSPDIHFRYSANPYRGCSHACAYCYARPSHEYLSLGAGTDFDRKIMVKKAAPELLAHAFRKPSWKRDVVVFSGVTDCYQPIEAEYRLTRACLEVCAEHRTPAGIITKSALVERDLDVLLQLRERAQVHVTISIPFWNDEVSRAIEPYTPTPARRIRVIRKLADAGISVGVNVAPIIPGLNDADIPNILAAAREAGASHAGYVLLRLPGSVKAVFEERIRTVLPLRSEKILRRIRETRGGELYQARFGERQVGTGVYADQIGAIFTQTCARLGFNAQGMNGAIQRAELTTDSPGSAAPKLRRPPKPVSPDQLRLFE